MECQYIIYQELLNLYPAENSRDIIHRSLTRHTVLHFSSFVQDILGLNYIR